MARYPIVGTLPSFQTMGVDLNGKELEVFSMPPMTEEEIRLEVTVASLELVQADSLAGVLTVSFEEGHKLRFPVTGGHHTLTVPDPDERGPAFGTLVLERGPWTEELRALLLAEQVLDT